MGQSAVMTNAFAYMLVILFGVLLGAVSLNKFAQPVEVMLFFILFAAAIALVFKIKWARKLISAASIAGIVYFAFKQIFMFNVVDVTSLALMGIFAFIIYFYRSSSIDFLGLAQDRAKHKWTILVVDDDLTFVKLVKLHFLKHGVSVISSESGERGLEMAKRWKPDLIILDVILPGMKGRSVCAKLKEDSITENIPVMFVTFKNSLDDISAEMELGAVMHLTKPVNYDHLYEQVHKILMKG
ncbi:MAG: response regulator [Candidatus Omnitrophica bacterium]|nr:response regulator [Candidatus Omnitrophota bacterium]